MNVAHKVRRKPRFDTQMPASLIAGLVLIMLLLLWSLSPQPSSPPPVPPAPEPPPVSMPSVPPPVIVVVKPEVKGCPRGCETPPPDCDIKGNISYRTGERIYHRHGQQYYEKTIIDPADGERWFCTEAEARANGWRKSKR
jgi:hypothetical protein